MRMTMTRAVRVLLALVVATVGLAATAAAQTNDEIFPTLQWNFSTPGARANGMGRSFIGIADDASAAVTNPAGLMSLTRPQVYAEFKTTRLKVDRLAAANSLTTLQPTANTTTVNALSFLSVSAPINSKLAVGFSVHRFLDYHETFSLATRLVPNDPANQAFFPVTGQADFTGTAFGGSVAYQVTEGLRIGLTVAGNRLGADSEATRNDFRADLTASNIIVNQTSIHDTQNAVSATIGALYKVNEMVSLGFSYEKSPHFNTTENLQRNPGFSTTPQSNQTLVATPGFPKDVQMNVPDHFGFGAAIRPNSKLLIAADAVRTNYASLSETTTIVFSTDTAKPTDYVTPDVTEFHVGAEYNVFDLSGNPLFVRAGVFTNPDHLVTYKGAPPIPTEVAKYNLLPRTDETRGTIGVGFVVGPRAQIDAAYVFGKEFVLSSGVRF
jgi:long-chain fatty acid transport protein